MVEVMYLTHQRSGLQTLCPHTKRTPNPISFPNSSSTDSNRTMATEAKGILEEVDSIMAEMRTNPVADMVEKFLYDNLMRLDTLRNDVRACLKQYIGWNRRLFGNFDKYLYLSLYMD